MPDSDADAPDGWVTGATVANAELRLRRAAGPYRLSAVLGAGGMGVVYRATGPDGTEHAVKTLRADLVDTRAVQRFAREASLRIAHPNVVRVLDDGTDADGTPFIVFELLAGESLEQRLTRGPLPVDEAVGIVLQACEGIAAAHDAGVVHRDVKPANLFLCSDGVVKVLDFGIAALGSGTKMTATGAVLGTPSYLSPEQARGIAEIDGRTDVWALGAVLYEALSGRPPFESESFFATVLAILMEPVPPLAARAPGVPSDVVDIVHRCLAKDRDARIADVRTLAAALRSRREPTSPSAPMSTAPTQVLSPRHTGIPEGEERIVVILLAEGVRDYAAVEQAVREHGGEPLTRFGGSALGLFGGAQWVGDEAFRAVEAALAVRPHAERVAVTSGRASSAQGGVAGAAVSAAERGCRADLGGVGVDGPTARTVANRFATERVSDELFEVLERRPPSWLAPRPPAAERLLGREAQVATVRFALETALSEGRAMVVAVTGPPGIGKTALRHEVERLIADGGEPVRTFVARAESLYRETAWSFLASLLRRHAVARGREEGWPRVDPEASVEERRRAVARLAAEAVDEPAAALEHAEFLGELLGVPMPMSVRLEAARQEPRLMADRIRLAVSDWFAGHARKGPVALLLENLDWADAASLDVLEQVVDDLEDEPLLVLVTSRAQPEGQSLFGGRAGVNVALRGIPRSAVAELAASLVGRPLTDPVVDLLMERTEGNPLFVRELVMALAEQGRLEAEQLADYPLPLSVEAAVQSRLDHLSVEERELCKRASVFGRPFSAEDLRGAGVDQAEELIAALRRRDIVSRHVGGPGRRQYGFRSPLVGEVAYRMIAADARASLHRRVAEHLATAATPDPEEVARHYDLGASPEPAARWWVRASLADAQRGDSPSVLRCSKRALEIGVSPEERWGLHMARAEALRFLLRRDEQHEELQRALGAAADDAERAQTRRQLAFWLSRSGKLDEATATGTGAVADADASGDAVVRALARCTLAQARIFAGSLDEADALLREAGALAVEAGPVVRAQVAESQALSASAQGDVGRTRAACAEAAEQYRVAGHVREAAMLEQNLADAYNRVGAFSEAEVALRDALEGCRRVKNRLGEAYALTNLGYAATMLGRTDEALSHLSEAEALASEMGDVRLGVAVRTYRARAELARGDHGAAMSVADEAAAQAAELGLGSLAVSALTLAAAARLRGGDLEGALEVSERAMVRRDDLGGIEEDEAEVFLVRARVLEASGRAEDARAVRTRGAERLRAVASRIADPELRGRFLSDVPANGELITCSGR